MPEEKQADLRTRLLELSRDPETVQSVTDALLSGLRDPKIKPGDAMKIYEFLRGLQTEDAAANEPPPDLDGMDLSAYTDEELRGLLLRLADNDASDGDSAGPETPSGALSPAGPAVRLRLEDYL